MISTVGLSKAAVLAALFNASKQQGLGVLDPSGARSMSEDDAGNVLGEYGPHLCFDYIRGRVMKVDLSEDQFDPRSYNRDNGDGAANRAIAQLRRKVGM